MPEMIFLKNVSKCMFHYPVPTKMETSLTFLILQENKINSSKIRVGYTLLYYVSDTLKSENLDGDSSFMNH